MKKYLNVKTIFLIISIMIIIAGLITTIITGFERSLIYKEGTRIEVYIPKGYEKQDIINIAKESFETEEIVFFEIEKLGQIPGIKLVKEYSEEQLNSYLNKISEKYGIEKEKIEYYEIHVPETEVITLVKPYILPAFFVTTISLIYIIIKNYKTESGVKIPLRILKILVITLGIYFSLISLFRLQINMYTMPLALTIYIVDLLIVVNKKCE